MKNIVYACEENRLNDLKTQWPLNGPTGSLKERVLTYMPMVSSFNKHGTLIVRNPPPSILLVKKLIIKKAFEWRSCPYIISICEYIDMWWLGLLIRQRWRCKGDTIFKFSIMARALTLLSASVLGHRVTTPPTKNTNLMARPPVIIHSLFYIYSDEIPITLCKIHLA